MTHYDINSMFLIADKDKDGLINPEEWEDFYLVFIVPYK
jgi:hypothetical protein